MNTFGNIFRISIFGESHGANVGVCIDGCPAGIALAEADFADDLQRRRSGARGTTLRIEADEPQIVSGIFNGKTTGAPLTILFHNDNTKSGDYTQFQAHPRPSHADCVARKKYKGFVDFRGGGHFSGRLTLALVAAGVVAKKIVLNIRIIAQLTEVGGQQYGEHDETLAAAMSAGDSLGGVVECRATGLPAGWGSPFFDSVESRLSHVVFAIPGVRGIEFGTGFAAAAMRGSEHNDVIIDERGTTQTNHAGGITGGITNGNELIFRTAFKPTASIALPQNTYNFETKRVEPLHIKGRHDVCFALRTPVIVEAVTAIVLADVSLGNL
ncbi:chorismate synthase [Bacteroidia bacterium]|nr:chorismate synthase [Bacteroidia bacterium]GHT80357.1 chorismate synthase [Bacteroidia bacterium]